MLGRGAMGVIYKAHDPVIDRAVAIKLIRADLLSGDDHSDYLARFQQDRKSTRLNSSHSSPSRMPSSA